ncbi:LysM peptidoglycan-binding domain-containing protein [Luteimonas salinisoli]|uniref:LysM peptidoglycan-binding domain-containing protein n=1 Tax=Luteimonas salinisoli TaxID=2752307 RepID=UPI0031F2F00D
MNRPPDGPDDDGPGKTRPDFSAVTGSSESTAAGDADRADFGKVRSSASSTAARSGDQRYVVEKGDNLSAISKKFYGSANHWREIFEANRDQLENPDLIHPGQTLRIPDRDGDASDPA